MAKSELALINPRKIRANDDNPRHIFDSDDLADLEKSIKEVGVLVPLIVHPDKLKKNHFVLLDGERRLRCARKLQLQEVPVNINAPPDRLQNILLMFNIHNVRTNWELVPTALKLDMIIKLYTIKSKKTPTNGVLSKITGMSAIRVSECKRILGFNKKYIDMALHPNPDRRIRGDFFSQLALPLEKLEENYPEIIKKYTKDGIIEIMIKKYREGTIVNIISEFRTLKKIISSSKKGVDKKIIKKSINKFLQSKPVRNKTGKMIKKAVTMNDVFEETSYYVYNEESILKTSETLLDLLSSFDLKKSKKPKEVKLMLKKVIKSINIMLIKLE